MAIHDIVYGFCKNFCKVEVMAKSDLEERLKELEDKAKGVILYKDNSVEAVQDTYTLTLNDVYTNYETIEVIFTFTGTKVQSSLKMLPSVGNKSRMVIADARTGAVSVAKAMITFAGNKATVNDGKTFDTGNFEAGNQIRVNRIIGYKG